MKKTKQELSRHLVKLGLTPDEAKIYNCLQQEGSLSANDIARKISVLPNAVYRLMKSLEKKGFTVSLDTHPKTFQVIPPVLAIKNFTLAKQKELEEQAKKSLEALSQTGKETSQTRIDFVTSKKQVFKKFVEMTKESTKEILIISIGEPVSDEVKLAMRDAKDREVNIKLIFHVHNKENELILQSWIRMGMEVKHYPDWGYHLIIFDEKKSLLVANNPKNTQERTGMIIYSQALTKALRDYFFFVWGKAEKIETK